MRARVRSSIVATIGYLLSPLSWWNDPFVNIPIAYVVALACGLVSRRLFSPAIVVAYWLTNLLGLVLLHRGAASLIAPGERWSRRRVIATNLVVSTVYTMIIVLLVHYGIIRFPGRGDTR